MVHAQRRTEKKILALNNLMILIVIFKSLTLATT